VCSRRSKRKRERERQKFIDNQIDVGEREREREKFIDNQEEEEEGRLWEQRGLADLCGTRSV
jgi:hypothetical protein